MAFPGLALAQAGLLTQLPGTYGCTSQTGSAGACADGNALGLPLDVVVSPDGANVYVAALDSDAVAVFARHTRTADVPVGALEQLEGQAGCVAEAGAGGCAVGVALDAPFGLGIGRDGKNVYIAASNSDAVAALARNRSKRAGPIGVLSQLPATDACVSEGGTAGLCGYGRAMDRPTAVLVASNGRQVYAATDNSDSIVILGRNKNPVAGELGSLEQLPGTDGCLSDDGTGGQCQDITASNGGVGVAASPDGKFVYMTAFTDAAVVAFARNKATGTLTQLSGKDRCVSETGHGGQCTNGRALSGARGIAVSPDGKFVYVAAETADAVAVFSRNPQTGGLTQLDGEDGCVQELGANGCAFGTALLGARDVDVSRDGRSLYVAANGSDAVAVFSRNRRSGALTQLEGTAGCISEDGTGGLCTDGAGLMGASGVAVSKDGRNVYVAAAASDAVAVFARTKK
jgi:DNA-binding beta-propeller fold protein YncE